MITKEIEVQVLNKNFNFNIPDSIKTEDFLEIIDYVDRKYKSIKTETTDINSFKLGLLVAINITEEFYSMMKENEKYKLALKRIDKIVAPIDEGNRVSISFSS
ncbi:MAG: cell division protein ZapA [bacterium]|nr:cell division protein ZapA [bacterium]